MAVKQLSIYFVIEDAKSQVSTLRFFLPISATLADAAQSIVTIGNSVSSLIKGSIKHHGIVYETDEDLSQSIDATADVQEKGTFVFRTAEGHPVEFSLPTFDEANLVAGSAEINEADTEVSGLITGVINGVNNTEPTPDVPGLVDSRAEDIVSYEKGYEDWGKRRK